MSAVFPGAASFEAFRAWRNNPSLWQPVIRDIAGVHRLPHDELELFPNGTNLVVALGRRHVVKLFPRMLRHQFVSERASLKALQGRLRVPTPELVAEGDHDDASYLVMTRLAGISGKEAWLLIGERQKEAVLAELGETIAEVQGVPPDGLAVLEPQWRDFLRRQIAGCKARHERLGLPRRFMAGLDGLLDYAGEHIPLDPPSVILTGEFVPENLLFTQNDGAWRLTGILDFGDVMTGFREYDLLGPSAFMCSGMPRRVRALLHGFGYADAAIDRELTRRLLALLFLHRFSNPLRQVAIVDWPEKARDLDELERLLWPVLPP
jgi:hygromycin-B 7''-O-kinase